MSSFYAQKDKCQVRPQPNLQYWYIFNYFSFFFTNMLETAWEGVPAIYYYYYFSFLVAVERSHVLSVKLHRGHQEVGVVPEITGVRVCCCETGLGQVWI